MPADPRTLLERSRDLRKNMTPEEKHLYYDGLKKLPWKFRRQAVLGNYIVDFYCPELSLVIEVDGTQHYEEAGKVYDADRDRALYEDGLNVLRYSNRDINQRFDAVIADIFNFCSRQRG